jgi:hypothetical protein
MSLNLDDNIKKYFLIKILKERNNSAKKFNSHGNVSYIIIYKLNFYKL